jgi:hypothetical protein
MPDTRAPVQNSMSGINLRRLGPCPFLGFPLWPPSSCLANPSAKRGGDDLELAKGFEPPTG